MDTHQLTHQLTDELFFLLSYASLQPFSSKNFILIKHALLLYHLAIFNLKLICEIYCLLLSQDSRTG